MGAATSTELTVAYARRAHKHTNTGNRHALLQTLSDVCVWTCPGIGYTVSVPGAQDWHMPLDRNWVPFGQRTHAATDDDRMGDVSGYGHCVQLVALLPYCPAGQAWHELDPGTELYWPAAHVVQAPPAVEY